MSTLKNYDSDSDLYIYVAFHNAYDDSIKVSQTKLEKLMKEIFKNDEKFAIVNSGEEDEDNEIIYRFQKPLLASDKELSVFFSRLRLVFQTTTEMSPHFTQFNGDRKEIKK